MKTIPVMKLDGDLQPFVFAVDSGRISKEKKTVTLYIIYSSADESYAVYNFFSYRIKAPIIGFNVKAPLPLTLVGPGLGNCN